VCGFKSRRRKYGFDAAGAGAAAGAGWEDEDVGLVGAPPARFPKVAANFPSETRWKTMSSLASMPRPFGATEASGCTGCAACVEESTRG
jgi:hypothetical protein